MKTFAFTIVASRSFYKTLATSDQRPATSDSIMSFFGHQKNWDYLTHEASEQRLASSYLFYGASGIGKKIVGLSFVKFLFCEKILQNNSKEHETEVADLFLSLSENLSFQTDVEKYSTSLKPIFPCNQCASCQKVNHYQHPDLFFVAPTKGTIKIDELRYLQKSLKKAPLEASYKIVVVDDAQDLTVQAANSLLKILEEPPKNTHFILITCSLFRLLPTIRSRCRPVFFHTPSYDESYEWLSNELQIPGDQAKHLLEMAEGSPGLALQLQQKGLLDVVTQLEGVSQSPISFSQMSQLAQGWIQEQIDLGLLLEIFKKKRFHFMLESRNFNQIKEIDFISDAQRDLERNVNKALVLENLLMELGG